MTKRTGTNFFMGGSPMKLHYCDESFWNFSWKNYELVEANSQEGIMRHEWGALVNVDESGHRKRE
jgi:hypothetical protein